MHFEDFTFSEDDQLQAPAVMPFDQERVPTSSFQDMTMMMKTEEQKIE